MSNLLKLLINNVMAPSLVHIGHEVPPCCHQKLQIKKKTKSASFSSLQKLGHYLCIEFD